jgi:hypothetical protein
MKHILSVLALAASGALVGSAGAYAAQADNSPGDYWPPSAYWQTAAAVMGPGVGLETQNGQRDVIEPPSSIDPGMALDPPQTGARMPIIRPPGPPAHGMVLPR